MNKLSFFFSICIILFFFIPSKGFSENKKKQTISSILWGKKPSESFIHTGMWTHHFKEHEKKVFNWKNRLIGLEHNGIFFVSLVNSHYKRINSIGISRTWYNKQLQRDVSSGFGYRVGGVYGYDKQLGKIAVEYKILPFAQIYTYFNFKHLRIELSSVNNQLVSLTLGIILKKY